MSNLNLDYNCILFADEASTVDGSPDLYSLRLVIQRGYLQRNKKINSIYGRFANLTVRPWPFRSEQVLPNLPKKVNWRLS